MQTLRGGSGRPGKRQALRRYPALAYLAIATGLALLLPSGLTLPNRGPSTLAEYAPVPGQGQGVSPIANLGETASGELGGLGDLGPGASVPASSTTLPPAAAVGPSRIVKKAGTKRCVGDPPRQTEDPLSPPCNSFFDGDNGGATSKGVTRDEVIIAIPSDGTPDPKPGAIVDCAQSPADDDNPSDAMCKGFMRYFNERYQTYGRRVHLFVTHFPPDQTAAETDARLHPFAVVSGGGIKYKTLDIKFGGGLRSNYQKNAPFQYSFRPDYEDAAAMTATMVCTKLNGKPAQFAGDPTMQSRTRKFGVWMQDSDVYRPLLLQALKDTCGIKDVFVQGKSSTGDTSAAAARANQAGVTTMFLDTGNTDFAVATQSATQQGWFPEWLLTGKPQERLNDVNFYARLADQNQWRHAFGITTDYRRDAPHDQWWYRAYREGCPECPEPTVTGYSFASFKYDQLALLFRAIQAAGPRLTPESADLGMHAIPPNGSPEPYKPAAYFAPGNFSYVKDSMLLWWDPSGVAPGATNPGCYRLSEGGKRYRAGEWKPDTNGLFELNTRQPCQGDPFAT